MDQHVIHLTPHAVARFRERVRPSLSLPDAEDELARLVLAAEVTPDPPAWHRERTAQLAPWYLVIADVVLPLWPSRAEPGALCATTCIPRGGLSDAARARRSARRRAAHRRARVPAAA